MKIKILDEVCTPFRANPTDAGLDLKVRERTVIPTGVTKLVPLGVACEIPKGYTGLLFPRSSLGKTPIRLTNSVGVIDSDYRGEICALLKNTSIDTMTLEKGQRVCQLVIVPIYIPVLEEVDELGDTNRGTGGFGSSREV